MNHAPVSFLSKLKMVLLLAVKLKLKFHQMYLSTAFLNDVIDDTVFVNPQPGYENQVTNGKLVQLIKSLHEFKEVSRMWNQTIDSLLRTEYVMTPSCKDCRPNSLHEGGKLQLPIITYVDDILIMS